MISCIAVIGASVRPARCSSPSRAAQLSDAFLRPQNGPLYIRSFDEEEELGFHYLAHVALDIVEEKLRNAVTARDDMYLGFLGPLEDYRAYVCSLPLSFARAPCACGDQ